MKNENKGQKESQRVPVLHRWHRAAQTITTLSPVALSALTDSTSKCSLPAAPSPQNFKRWILASLAAVGHTSASSAHVVVCSPVAELHLSLKALKGSFTSTKSDPAGTENLFLKQPRPRATSPPLAQAKSALVAPDTNDTRK